MLKPISNTIQGVINFTWPMVVISAIILVSFRVCYLIKSKQKIVLYKELSMLIFGIYILCLFQIVTSTDISSSYGNNFIPFKEIMRYKPFSNLFMKNVVGNVLLFLPYGYFVGRYFAGKSKVLSIFLITLASVAIEYTQLSIGRVFDVDDILLNVIGGTLGYMLFLFSNNLFDSLPKICKTEWFLNTIFILLLILFFVFLGFLLV
mgnify:CR=1 FL=1